MIVEYQPNSKYRTTPVIHIDSETPEVMPERDLYLSVTGWSETAKGEVQSRNVFVTLDREALIGLQAVINQAIEENNSKPPRKFKRKRK